MCLGPERNAHVMSGIHISKASVVASGGVVVNDVQPYCMVAGIPPNVVKGLPGPEEERP